MLISSFLIVWLYKHMCALIKESPVGLTVITGRSEMFACRVLFCDKIRVVLNATRDG